LLEKKLNGSWLNDEDVKKNIYGGFMLVEIGSSKEKNKKRWWIKVIRHHDTPSFKKPKEKNEGYTLLKKVKETIVVEQIKTIFKIIAAIAVLLFAWYFGFKR
jgi:hypothetical protein